MTGKLTLLAALLTFLGASLATAVTLPPKPGDYIRPPECHKAKYTCVLKVVDGAQFWCMKPVRDRYRDAQKTFRAPTQMRCTDRFPAYLKNPPNEQPEG